MTQNPPPRPMRNNQPKWDGKRDKYAHLQIELSDTELPQGVRRAQVIESTRNLLGELISRKQLDSYYQWVPLHSVDVNAIVINHNHTNPRAIHFYHYLLKEGRTAGPLFEKILSKVNDPNALVPSALLHSNQERHPLWQAYARIGQVDFLSAMIADARIDIEVPDSIHQQSLMNKLLDKYAQLTLDNAQAAAQPSNPTQALTGYRLRGEMHRSRRLYAGYTNAIQSLLERGAVIDPESLRHGDTDSRRGQWSKAMLLHEGLLRDEIADWQRDWQAFVSENQPVDALNTEQFSHFFSLGKLRELMMSEQWYGQEAGLIERYHELPDWAQKRYPMTQEIAAMMARLTPDAGKLSDVCWGGEVTPKPSKVRQ